MSTMTVLGEREETWDPADPEQVARAREVFEEITKSGDTLAVKMTEERKGEQIKKFDPEAERIVISRSLQGG